MTRFTTRKRKTDGADDPFSFFKDTTFGVFGFLVADFGFDLSSVNVHIPECSIVYWNATTSVRVYYEWGGIPWVQMSQLKRTAKEVLEIKECGLDALITLRCPQKWMMMKSYNFEEATDQDIKNILRNYGEVLKEYGNDILTGDFQVFPQLNKIAIKHEKKVNKQYYGSESGETPEPIS